MICLALTGKCGLFGIKGDPEIGVVAPCASHALMPNKLARLSAPKPIPVRTSSWRRVKILSSGEAVCSRMYLDWELGDSGCIYRGLCLTEACSAQTNC